MDIRALKIFRDVAVELSFVRVARINQLSQPSITSYIKRLEDYLNTKLFDRSPNGVALTPEGKLLLPYAESLIRDYEALRMAAGEIKKLPKGEIRIASIHSIGMYEIGSVLREFMHQYPGIHIKLQYRQAEEIYDLVLNKKVEIGLVAYPERRASISSTVYGSDRLVAILPRGHHLSSHKQLTVEQLAGCDFVAFDEGIPTREAVDALLRKHKTSVRIRMTNDNIFAIKNAVEIGIGISIVPDSTVEGDLRSGSLAVVALAEKAAKRPLAIIQLARRPLSKSCILFLDLLKQNITTENP